MISSDSTDGYLADADYSIWAFITFPIETGALEVGGVSTSIGVDLS